MIAAAIKYIYPDINFPWECALRDDGSGVYIDEWRSTRYARPTDEQIQAAILPAAKVQRIGEINAECTRRLVSRWGPPERQVSVLAGIYGSAERDLMTASIFAHIDASNDASDAVLQATTVAAAEAVVPQWPELPA